MIGLYQPKVLSETWFKLNRTQIFADLPAMRVRKASFRIPELGSGRVHADINSLYILNPKNLRSSASKMGFSMLSSYMEEVHYG